MSYKKQQGQYCPICGKENGCSEAIEKISKPCTEDKTCWCMQIDISNKVKAKLAKLTEKNSCVCQTCLAQMQQNQQ